MKIFAETTAPPKPKSKNIVPVSFIAVGLLVLMAVGQLFEFENFIPLIQSFGFGGGKGMATLIAGLIVVSEVLALPFLLRMHLSPLFRIFSMVMGWLAAGLWIWIALYLNVTTNAVSNVGFIGTKIDLPVGLWAVCYALSLGVLLAWVSWGLWPKAPIRK